MAPPPIEPRGKRLKLPVYTVHLVREASLLSPPGEEAVTSPRGAAALLRRYIGPADREHCVVLLLGARHEPLGVHTVSIGTLNEALVHPREVFKVALLAGAHSIIVAHNHPSGECTPSPEDRVVADRLARAGTLLGVRLADFIVIGHLRHVSFAERGDL